MAMVDVDGSCLQVTLTPNQLDWSECRQPHGAESAFVQSSMHEPMAFRNGCVMINQSINQSINRLLRTAA